MEGSRPLLVEVQALVAPAGYGTPARTASGHRPEPARRCWLRSWRGAPGSGSASHDVYANLAGGLSVGEPGLDLPLALALASSLRDRPVAGRDASRSARSGLLGELRSVAGLERRLREAARLGFETRHRPASVAGRRPVGVDGMRIVEVATLRDALEAALAGEPERHGDAARRC